MKRNPGFAHYSLSGLGFLRAPSYRAGGKGSSYLKFELERQACTSVHRTRR
jgi:hypothetical protein